MRLFFTRFWAEKTRSFFSSLFFIVLCFCEYIYSFFFWCFQCFQKYILPTAEFSNKQIISIGNIVSGGTGKSLLALYLLKKLDSRNCSLLLRGYKSTLGRKTKSERIRLSDKPITQELVKRYGDEALCAAKNSEALIFVGKDRVSSLKQIASIDRRYNSRTYKPRPFVVLDDGYQNFSVKKNCEILLLDGRNIFGNNHALPAGPLREKDITRADIIVVTHADDITDDDQYAITKTLSQKLSPDFVKKQLFWAYHKFAGFYAGKDYFVSGKRRGVSAGFFAHKHVCLFAGIGSFQGFVTTVTDEHVSVEKTVEFPDHHTYRERDIKRICEYVTNSGKFSSEQGPGISPSGELELAQLLEADKKIVKRGHYKKSWAFITTEKDWIKLAPLLEEKAPELLQFFYVTRVEFALFDRDSEDLFIQSIQKDWRL